MAFPIAPALNAEYLLNGTTYIYNGAAWDIKAGTVSGTIDGLSDVDITTVAIQTDEGLKWDGTKFVPTTFPSATQTTAPILSFVTPVDENTVGHVITISNYDTGATYTFGTTGDIGTINYTSGALNTVNIIDSIDHNGTITCYATKAGELKSITASEAITITYITLAGDTSESDSFTVNPTLDGFTAV